MENEQGAWFLNVLAVLCLPGGQCHAGGQSHNLSSLHLRKVKNLQTQSRNEMPSQQRRTLLKVCVKSKRITHESSHILFSDPHYFASTLLLDMPMDNILCCMKSMDTWEDTWT